MAYWCNWGWMKLFAEEYNNLNDIRYVAEEKTVEKKETDELV